VEDVRNYGIPDLILEEFVQQAESMMAQIAVTIYLPK
jgi:hypothetical protein